ncbi:putative DNA-binding domain-containing protein [Ditylenchus destructor]|nr:putative DNA-binding domain-containing protein [Ditylenchus destructor]
MFSDPTTSTQAESVGPSSPKNPALTSISSSTKEKCNSDLRDSPNKESKAISVAKSNDQGKEDRGYTIVVPANVRFRGVNMQLDLKLDQKTLAAASDISKAVEEAVSCASGSIPSQSTSSETSLERQHTIVRIPSTDAQMLNFSITESETSTSNMLAGRISAVGEGSSADESKSFQSVSSTTNELQPEGDYESRKGRPMRHSPTLTDIFMADNTVSTSGGIATAEATSTSKGTQPNTPNTSSNRFAIDDRPPSECFPTSTGLDDLGPGFRPLSQSSLYRDDMSSMADTSHEDVTLHENRPGTSSSTQLEVSQTTKRKRDRSAGGQANFCAFVDREKGQCKQRAILTFNFCIRHILHDPNAPYKRCQFTRKPKSKNDPRDTLCTNAIKSDKPEIYCSTHLIMKGLIQPKTKKPKTQIPPKEVLEAPKPNIPQTIEEHPQEHLEPMSGGFMSPDAYQPAGMHSGGFMDTNSPYDMRSMSYGDSMCTSYNGDSWDQMSTVSNDTNLASLNPPSRSSSYQHSQGLNPMPSPAPGMHGHYVEQVQTPHMHTVEQPQVEYGEPSWSQIQPPYEDEQYGSPSVLISNTCNTAPPHAFSSYTSLDPPPPQQPPPHQPQQRQNQPQNFRPPKSPMNPNTSGRPNFHSAQSQHHHQHSRRSIENQSHMMQNEAMEQNVRFRPSAPTPDMSRGPPPPYSPMPAPHSHKSQSNQENSQSISRLSKQHPQLAAKLLQPPIMPPSRARSHVVSQDFGNQTVVRNDYSRSHHVNGTAGSSAFAPTNAHHQHQSSSAQSPHAFHHPQPSQRIIVTNQRSNICGVTEMSQPSEPAIVRTTYPAAQHHQPHMVVNGNCAHGEAAPVQQTVVVPCQQAPPQHQIQYIDIMSVAPSPIAYQFRDYEPHPIKYELEAMAESDGTDEETKIRRDYIQDENSKRKAPKSIKLRKKCQKVKIDGGFRLVPQIDTMCKIVENHDFDSTDLFPLGLEPSDDETSSDDSFPGFSNECYSQCSENRPSNRIELYLMKKQLRLESARLVQRAKLSVPITHASKKFKTCAGASLRARQMNRKREMLTGVETARIRRCTHVTHASASSDPLDGRKTQIMCLNPCLPMSNHCAEHVLYNVNQKLFSYCTRRCCGRPVLCTDGSLFDGLCRKHFEENEASDKASTEPAPPTFAQPAPKSALVQPHSYQTSQQKQQPQAQQQPSSVKVLNKRPSFTTLTPVNPSGQYVQLGGSQRQVYPRTSNNVKDSSGSFYTDQTMSSADHLGDVDVVENGDVLLASVAKDLGFDGRELTDMLERMPVEEPFETNNDIDDNDTFLGDMKDDDMGHSWADVEQFLRSEGYHGDSPLQGVSSFGGPNADFQVSGYYEL